MPVQTLATHQATWVGQPVPRAESESGLTFEVGESLFGQPHDMDEDMARRIRQAIRQDEAALIPLRVLCVDDNRDTADTQVAVLGLFGYEAQACYDGLSALAVVPEFRPDACLLDLAMPGMGGLELSTQLKAQAGPQPLLLIATTALGEWEVKTQTAVAGFHYHFIKPVDTTAVLTALNQFANMLHHGLSSLSKWLDHSKQ